MRWFTASEAALRCSRPAFRRTREPQHLLVLFNRSPSEVLPERVFESLRRVVSGARKTTMLRYGEAPCRALEILAASFRAAVPSVLLV